MSLNFVGRRYGKYTILRFTGTQYECSCTCGRRIEYVGIGLSKPTYKGRRMCALCAGSPCQVCGTLIPARPGKQSTCSETCAKQHTKNRGRDYYERVKKTPEYQKMHAKAVQSHKNRKQLYQEYAEIMRAYHRHMDSLRRERIKHNPAMRESYLKMKRDACKASRLRIEAEPMGWEAFKFKSRLWYQSLSPFDKDRIYIKQTRNKTVAFLVHSA